MQGLDEKIIPDTKRNTTPNKSFVNAFVRCRLSTEQLTNGHGLQVTCANSAEYEKSAKQTKQFNDLFTANHPSKKKDVVIANLVQDASPTRGYNTASGFVQLQDGEEPVPVYYYQTPDKAWHYFTATPVLIPCTDYSTIDLKKAYFGTECHDPAVEFATVNL
ncbi:hypothetical protein IPL68_03720 [Candidatus Saccharibacteria bacterium]|nr:MAG: hypothetical protein IPL68_03720 [Candidatus Saccharibacteria bacterium]